MTESDGRDGLQALVIGSLEHLGLASALRGSWMFGDFHYSTTDGVSFSDIDLVSEGVSAEAAAETAIRVRTALPMISKVSVHPCKALDESSLHDAKWLLVGEMIAGMRGVFRVNGRRSTYVLAKVALLMARTSIQERYIETARRVGSLADDLLGVKLGDVDGMRLESVRELLVGYGGLAGQEAWNLCQVGHLPKGYVDSYEQLLASMAPGVDAWLRAYVVAKARSVEA